MTSLLSSASLRKRDQLRATEKKLLRDREKEGDEFAGTETFVTGAYKRQQEENLKLEEDEARREKEEEERKRKGEGGMTGWNRKVLEREEERMKLVEEGVERLRREKGQAGEERSGSGGPLEGSDPHHAYDLPEAEAPTAATTEANEAAALNARGAHISLNDDGDVVDKRQLLSAGLNVAKQPPQTTSSSSAATAAAAKAEADAARRRRDEANYGSRSNARDAKTEQRERQSRMIAEQLAAAEEAGRVKEEEERKGRVEMGKSGRTEEEKMGARERFLKRKMEREREREKAGET